MPNTKDTILIIVARYLCYASNEWFALSLAKALKDYGQSVEVCNIMSKEDADLQSTSIRHTLPSSTSIPRCLVQG